MEVAITVMKKFDEDVPFRVPEVVIREMFRPVLRHVFNFNGTTYRQKYGTSWGTSMVAPRFAILYMAHLKEEFWRDRPLNTYIDNIFRTWSHGIDEQKESRMEYTKTISKTETNFLDVTLYKGDRD